MQIPSSLDKAVMLGKVEGKRRRGRPAARWMDSVTVVMNALLEELKDRLGTDHHGENLSMWSLRVDTNLMAHNQSINQSINLSIYLILRKCNS